MFYELLGLSSAELVYDRCMSSIDGQRSISDADCLREIIQRFLDGIDTPLQRDRSKIWIHLDATAGTGLT